MATLFPFVLFVPLCFTLSMNARTDIYILAGQSNMVGVAPVEDEPAPEHPGRLLMMDHHGNFRRASDPLISLAPGQEPVGVGPGLWFAEGMAELCPDTYIGVIQCARAGSYIEDWLHKTLYWNLLRQAKKASEHGRIVGLIWYQGESDSRTAESAALYWTRQNQLFENFRKDLGIADLPIVFVQLGPDPQIQDTFPYWSTIQEVQQAIGNRHHSNTRMVAAMDLTYCIPYHLDQKSQIILGRRMAQ